MRSFVVFFVAVLNDFAYGVSDAASESNPIEKVETLAPIPEAEATTTLESTPPDRKKPSGTSAIIWSRTEASIRLRSSSAASSAVSLRAFSETQI